MTEQSANRKYTEAWTQLKIHGVIQISIPRIELYTPSQIAKQLKTIRKGMSKEKYQDWEFKDAYPNAEVTSVLEISTGKITFTLDKDTKDISKLFGL